MENTQDFYEKGWRLSVGIVLFNSNKDIFMGERLDNKGAWQMPQGGVKLNKNECLLNAAKENFLKKLELQILVLFAKAINGIIIICRKFLSKKLWKGKFIGQKQKWFAFEFLGEDDEINIRPENIKQEFCNWKWVAPNNVCELIINFKKIPI